MCKNCDDSASDARPSAASLKNSGDKLDASRPPSRGSGELRDPNPERLERASKSESEIEDDLTEGTSKLGTPSPGPARLAGSDH
jgi:hypothetical protein